MSEPNFPKSGNDFPTNPYVSQPSSGAYMEMPEVRSELQLASVLQRFMGFLIDAIFGMVCSLPGLVLTIAGAISFAMEADRLGNNQTPPIPATMIFGIVLITLGFIVPLAVQITLLATRSQSFGKYCLNLQIVDFESGKPAGFIQSFVVRFFAVWLITTVPCFGAIFSIVDSCFVFRQDRRCIHDLLASTTVIDRSGGSLR